MIDTTTDPRKVGGGYWSGYWQMSYRVTAMHGGTITAEWADGTVTTHQTPWDARRDVILTTQPWDPRQARTRRQMNS
jgi:hypothetical protein